MKTFLNIIGGILGVLFGVLFALIMIGSWLGFFGLIPYGADSDDSYGKETPAFYPMR